MRIGILTYHCVPNFGAQLQALSTVCYLKKAGYVPIMLNWYPKDLQDMYEKRVGQEQIKVHDDFTKTYLPVTETCRNEKDLIDAIKKNKIDRIVVGSDALFKYTPLIKRFSLDRAHYKIKRMHVVSCEKLEGNPFFGEFLKSLSSDIKAAAFSVSSQNCPFNTMLPTEKKKMKRALENYSYISVRDSWTQKMVENVLGKDTIRISPDPVFSFNQNCEDIIPSKDQILKKYNLPTNYVLLSFGKHYTNKKYVEDIINELKQKGLTSVWLPMPEDAFTVSEVDVLISTPLNPMDWYSLIKYSCGYIGERMHPIVVSLHNSIPFYCFDEYGIKTFTGKGLKREYNKETSKTYLIVKRAGLLENLFSYKENTDFPHVSIVVNGILNFDKTKCSEFARNVQDDYQQCMKDVLKKIL